MSLVPWYLRYAPQLVAAVVVFLLAVVLVFSGARCSRRAADFRDVKAVVKAQNRAAEQTTRSVQISKDTQERVEKESADTRQRTARAVEKIDARIQAEPAAPGPADPDVLHIAREAHQRALSAHCRVQRAGDCPDAAATP
ncbi:hypothetical protein [Pseudoxanthomonas sacheonensis]|uniref:hypothetical protein n=1 Tax=Pseudoxanthomonas sacheonensis TaxID=443615 RepID=UPI0013D2D800|nr:hypothetical protein [Pseudoxanthomonas sacheonensis]KAF1706275.1 hypothetical protein CSC73_16355 [Pseudoxanthomonas sacheonensis]